MSRRLAVLGLTCLVALGGCRDLREVDAAEATPPVPVPPALGDTLCADIDRSVVRWRGTEFRGRGKHEGIVRLASGRLNVQDSVVTGGTFVIDMNTITIADIPQHEVVPRRRLRTHLRDEDFFAVDRFPVAAFVITGVRPQPGPGRYSVSGNLTVRDSTHNISFEASAPLVSEDRVWASARVSIDRHRWGVSFIGSRLTKDLVDPLIQLELSLVATSESSACGPAALGGPQRTRWKPV